LWLYCYATVDLRCCKHGASVVDSCSNLVAGATAGAARPAALAVAIVTGTGIARMQLCLLRSACSQVPPPGELDGLSYIVIVMVESIEIMWFVLIEIA